MPPNPPLEKTVLVAKCGCRHLLLSKGSGGIIQGTVASLFTHHPQRNCCTRAISTLPTGVSLSSGSAPCSKAQVTGVPQGLAFCCERCAAMYPEPFESVQLACSCPGCADHTHTGVPCKYTALSQALAHSPHLVLLSKHKLSCRHSPSKITNLK
jgi:hypothetical protein